MLSFNCSVAGDKTWLRECNFPIQIMPQTTRIPTNESIMSYPENTEWKDSVIHTSYITRVFGNLHEYEKEHKCKYNLLQYVKLCDRLKYKRLLIHLPQSLEELNNIGNGMNIIITLCNKFPQIIVALEIPSFKTGFKMNIVEYFTIIISYFKLVTNNNIEIVFDTAHLFANGLNGKDMITLFETIVNDHKLIDYCNIIHLNGNERNMYSSDKHCPIFSVKNKIKDVDEMIKYLSSHKKIMIAENTTEHASYDDWKNFAKQYNIEIIKEDSHLGI